MTDEERERDRQLGKLVFALGKDLFARGTVKDAVVWEGRSGLRAAWIMDPKRMYAAGVAHDRHVPFNGAYAAHVLERRGLRGETLKYEREMFLGDFLPRISNDVSEVVDEPLFITIIPTPGYPWPAPEGYYSAKLDRRIRSDRPEWLFPENVVDPARAIDSPGVNLCTLFPDPIGGDVGAEVARYGRKMDDYFIVTHAMGTVEGMTRHGTVEGVAGWEENAQKVIDCGGLLFPSLAIGAVPATNFGVAVLVADVGVVLGSLKPNLKRGQRAPAAVYSSDAWSGRTGSFFADSAVEAFEQMHGHSNYIYYTEQNVWPMGAPRAWAVAGPGTVADEVYKVTTLKKELRERFAIWHRHLEPEDVEHIHEHHSMTKARYGYLEAKVNGVMGLDKFPMAVVPPQQEHGFRRFLDMTGFDGELLVVDIPDELFEVMLPDWRPADVSFERRKAIQAWAYLQYGWEVAGAIRKVANVVKV